MTSHGLAATLVVGGPRRGGIGHSRSGSWLCALLLVAGTLAARPVVAQTPVITEELKLIATDAVAVDSFGRSVDMDGDVAVVGASQNDDGGLNEGAAYVYR